MLRRLFPRAFCSRVSATHPWAWASCACPTTVLMSLLVLGAAPTPVVVDGRPLPASALATVNEKSYVALRPVGQALGAQVSFDGKLRQATVTTEFREVVLV